MNREHSAEPSPQSRPVPQPLPGIKHIVAVGSGKGGVGKSTVSVNLALALQRIGARVGLVDADILGPSVPVMLGLPTGQPPEALPDGTLFPVERFGISVISMGMLTGDERPAILRGPMVSRYLRLFVEGVHWGELDYLILDLAPGTGDTQLTLAQSLPLSGAIVVTTPQEVSLKIARRGLRMFETLHVPVLGIIENMSAFVCPHCGGTTDVFGREGGERMSRRLGVPFLGSIPLDAEIAAGGDAGRPTVLERPNSPAALAYLTVAAEISGRLAQRAPALGPFLWTWETGAGAPEWLASAVRSAGSSTTPAGFRKCDPRTLAVLWEDGAEESFDVRDLRLACRCALCVEEMSGRALLDPKTVRQDVAPRTIRSIGNYGIAVDWNDGHSTGIYAFENLRALASLRAAADVADV